MNDPQASPAGIGEVARVAAAPTAPYLGAVPRALGVDPEQHADDLAQVHASIAAAPREQQAIVLQRLRLIDQIAQAIRGQTNDPIERARMAQHIAQMHPEMGIDPGMLTPQAMSDENITALHELAIEATLKVALASLGAKVATRGPPAARGESSPTTDVTELAMGSPPVQRRARPTTDLSHAAQGFTILGVEQ